jgi:membrane-associated phospholipid phosphatase
MTASIQRISLTNATILYHHMAWIDPPRAYYVAFPSMHVAQPLIAAWFLRRWRVVSTAIAAYCVLLVGAIIILRWHYAADLLAGFFVAALAVWIVSAGQPMTAQARGKASEGALI